MPATPTEAVTGLFDQAVQTFGEALRAGVKAQEQIAGFWSEALRMSPNQDYQRKARTFLSDAVPAAQKSTEELLRTIDANYRRSVELLKKACDSGNVATAADMQSRAQNLWETSVELVKENTQALAQTNARILEMWADLLRQNGATATAPVTSPTPGPRGQTKQQQ